MNEASGARYACIDIGSNTTRLLVAECDRGVHEVHQERVARMRNRPVDNKWIGMRISDPDIDLAGLARAQGAAGFGPVRRLGELKAVLGEALRSVAAGKLAVVDVWVEPGYDSAASLGGKSEPSPSTVSNPGR